MGDNTNYEDPRLHPSIYLLHKEARTALSNLRLVDKTLNRSATRVLFRGVRARLGHGVSSISKLETLSSSEYAKHVRLIHLEIGYMESYDLVRDEEDGEGLEDDEDENEDLESEEEVDEEDEDGNLEGQEEVDEGGFIRLSDKCLDHLSILIAKFRNLKAVNIWPEHFTPLEKAMGLLSQIITTIANLQLRGFIHRVTNLGMPIDGVNHLMTLLDKDDHQTAIQHFLQRVQHMNFIGFIGIDASMGDVPTELIDLDALIKSSPNLLSLSMLKLFALVPLVKFNPSLRLRLESLELLGVKITSYDLLALLEACKESIKFISLDCIELVSGSWLHVLVQIKKNLNLITFIFMQSDPFLEELGGGGEGNEHQRRILWRALGDIQRQTNANRIAARLKPWTAKTYSHLSCPSLKSSIGKKYYRELSSRNWDAEDSTA